MRSRIGFVIFLLLVLTLISTVPSSANERPCGGPGGPLEPSWEKQFLDDLDPVVDSSRYIRKLAKIEPYFRGKHVVVTGGSSGIGKSLAIMLTRMGASVTIIARDLGRINKTVQQLQWIQEVRNLPGQTIVGVSADVGDREAIEEVISKILSKGKIDMLINNAGIAEANQLEDTTPETVEGLMRTNYFGPYWATRAVLKHMKERKTGHIANVSSLAGAMGFFGYAPYAASKFAVVGFTEALRSEVRPDGIRVSLLLPSDVDTPQLKAENQTKPAETRAISGNVKPMHPNQVAYALLAGMAKDRFVIVPGFQPWLIYHLNRLAPGLVRWIMDSDVRRAHSRRIQEETTSSVVVVVRLRPR